MRHNRKMVEPSEYELAAWRSIQRFKGRPLSRVMKSAGDQVAIGASELGKRATNFLESHPKAQSAVSRGQDIATGSSKVIGAAARKAAAGLPDGMVDWSGAALASIRNTGGRV